MTTFDEIKRLYFNATKATIERDIERAIDLLKTLETEEERERVAVYLDGLSQMRSEWRLSGARPARPAATPRSATRPARSGRSKPPSGRGR